MFVCLCGCLPVCHKIIPSARLSCWSICQSVYPSVRLESSILQSGWASLFLLTCLHFNSRIGDESKQAEIEIISEPATAQIWLCSECQIAFQDSESLKDHVTSEHNIGEFPEPEAPKSNFLVEPVQKKVFAAFCELTSGLYYTRMACTLNMIMINHNWWL